MRKRDFLRGKGFCVITIILGLFILHPLHLFGQQVKPARPRGIEIKDNLISANLRDADLSEVLKEIEKATGVKMTIAKELAGEKVNVYFEDLDVESALKTILDDATRNPAINCFYIFTYSRDSTKKEKSNLKEVKIEANIRIGSKPAKVKMIPIEIPYGSGKGEIGVSSGGEGAIIGPRAFAVDDKENIYIYDTLNNRVQIYSPNGEYQSTVPLRVESKGMFRDMVVDNSDFIYLFDGMRLFQYDQKGNVLAEISVDKGGRGIGAGGMHIIGNGIYIYSCDKESCWDYLIARISSDCILVDLSGEDPKKYKEKGKQVLSGRRYITSLDRITFRQGKMEIIGRDGTLSNFISFTLNGILSIAFLGEDQKGNLYIKTEQREDENKELVVEVHKFDANYEYLDTMTIPRFDLWYGHPQYFVSKSGDVYSFRPGKDKLRLNMSQSHS